MKTHSKPMTFLMLFLLSSTSLLAQKTLKDLAESDDKKFNKLTTTGTPFADQIKMMAKQDRLTKDDLKPIKRVGLVTAFIADYNEVEVNKTDGYGYSITTTTYKFLTVEGASRMIEVFLKSGVPQMKQEFKDRGMELLLPVEFNDTQAKKDIYKNYEMDISKTIDKLGNLGYRGLANLIYPEDVRMIWATKAEGLDNKQQRSLGKFAKDLGLDAIIAIEVSTQIDGNKVDFKGVAVTMFGPNPEKYDPNRKYPGIMGAGGYWEGWNYGYIRMNLGDGIPVCKLKKKEIVEDYSEGGAAVVNRTVLTLVDLVKEKMVWQE